MQLSTFATSFADWSDLLSLTLLSLALISNDLDPAIPLWGLPLHTALLQSLTLTALLSFTAFRFLLEGLYSAPAPREFLALSVVYAARWLYLLYTLRTATFPGRLARLARSLRALQTLRYGTSTHPSRRGSPEIVLRRGARRAEEGELYWRGKVERVDPAGSGFVVRLIEPGMHADKLSALATIDYAAGQKSFIDDFYRRVYETVMSVEGAGDARVDWAPFLDKYSAIGKTQLAVRAGATGDGDLAGVARRVAADACLYVTAKRDSGADAQVEIINSCLEKAAEEMARGLREEAREGDKDGSGSESGSGEA